MNYLSASEYETYGIEAATPESWVAAASALIDSACRRPTLTIQTFIERVRLTPGINNVHLTYLPLASADGQSSPLLACRGRYAAPRRGTDLTLWEFTSEVALAFALPGTWIDIDVSGMDYCAETGEVSWLPNPLGLQFQEIELEYSAGYATIPDPVKYACAQIVRNAQATPALNVRSNSVSNMHMEYFSDTLLDSNVKLLLASYVAQKVA